MTGKVTVAFEDGTEEVILLGKEAIVLDIPSKEISFRQDAKGRWLMVVTKGFLQGRKLANDFLFLKAEKIPCPPATK